MVPDARIDREIARGELDKPKVPMPKPLHLTALGMRSCSAIKSDGGSTSYYELPEGASELNDLIEHKRMSFALGNIFKACYRFGEKDAASRLYDLNKIIFFAERLKAIEQRAKNRTAIITT
ncbi:hypothetical protein AB664_07750 [Brucella anthropi]|uniref:Uncharacterized protein n=1 Tax=Brucella anthropi TaxID=529 RepID=A0A656Z451_BRUAN|nr:hypothetical protein AB664_07750 [Brucella anthropi]